MWDGKIMAQRFRMPGGMVVVYSFEREPVIPSLMGAFLEISVLERKDKQSAGRSAYLMLYESMPVKRKGEMVKAGDLRPGDIVWWNGEPLKVVEIREREKTNEKETGG